MLSITREQFREIYAGTTVLEYEELFYTQPTSYEDLIANYMPSKLWRLNNIYTIIDKWGNRIPFKMKWGQHVVYAETLRHPRIIVLKSRQQGISTLWLVSYFDDALFNADFKVGLMAQGIDEAATLLERTKTLWEELDLDIKNFLGRYVHGLSQPIQTGRDNTKEFSFSNNSTLFVRVSFRSTTLQRLHVSEFGKISNKDPKKAKEVRTGTLQALAMGNTGVIESTAEGKNSFKEMWDTAVKLLPQDRTLKDFVPVFLSWLDDPDCVLDQYQTATTAQIEYFDTLEKELNRVITQPQRNFWIAQERELSEDIFKEYPATAEEAFTIVKDGAYYAKLYKRWVLGGKRKIRGLFDRNLEVQCVFDLGMNDTMACGFFQTYNSETRQIDEYSNSGEDIAHYCEVMQERAKAKGYTITRIVLPHDADVKDLTTGKTRRETFEEHMPGVTVDVLERVSKEEGRDAVRRMLKSFWIDADNCSYSEDCFLNYRKKWDEKAQIWLKDHEHDEFSNGADMERYAALGLVHSTYKGPIGTMKSRPRKNKGMDI